MSSQSLENTGSITNGQSNDLPIGLPTNLHQEIVEAYHRVKEGLEQIGVKRKPSVEEIRVVIGGESVSIQDIRETLVDLKKSGEALPLGRYYIPVQALAARSFEHLKAQLNRSPIHQELLDGMRELAAKSLHLPEPLPDLTRDQVLSALQDARKREKTNFRINRVGSSGMTDADIEAALKSFRKNNGEKKPGIHEMLALVKKENPKAEVTEFTLRIRLKKLNIEFKTLKASEKLTIQVADGYRRFVKKHKDKPTALELLHFLDLQEKATASKITLIAYQWNKRHTSKREKILLSPSHTTDSNLVPKDAQITRRLSAEGVEVFKTFYRRFHEAPTPLEVQYELLDHFPNATGDTIRDAVGRAPAKKDQSVVPSWHFADRGKLYAKIAALYREHGGKLSSDQLRAAHLNPERIFNFIRSANSIIGGREEPFIFIEGEPFSDTALTMKEVAQEVIEKESYTLPELREEYRRFDHLSRQLEFLGLPNIHEEDDARRHGYEVEDMYHLDYLYLFGSAVTMNHAASPRVPLTLSEEVDKKDRDLLFQLRDLNLSEKYHPLRGYVPFVYGAARRNLLNQDQATKHLEGFLGCESTWQAQVYAAKFLEATLAQWERPKGVSLLERRRRVLK